MLFTSPVKGVLTFIFVSTKKQTLPAPQHFPTLMPTSSVAEVRNSQSILFRNNKQKLRRILFR